MFGSVGWPLTLLHTQDTFGTIVAVDGLNSPCRPVGSTYVDKSGDPDTCVGGVARRAAFIAQVRSANLASGGHTLAIDTGNLFSGS